MSVESAVLLLVGILVPIASGLLLPTGLLRWFGPLWTVVPPVLLTYHYLQPGTRYDTPDGFVGALFVFLFILVWPWMIWSRTVFRLLRERRSGIRHEPPKFLMRP